MGTIQHLDKVGSSAYHSHRVKPGTIPTPLQRRFDLSSDNGTATGATQVTHTRRRKRVVAKKVSRGGGVRFLPLPSRGAPVISLLVN